MNYKFSLNSSAGELDSVTVELDGDGYGVTEAAIHWLKDNHIILADGDTIRIAELEG